MSESALTTENAASSAAVTVPRDDAIELLKGLPADSTYDDVLREIIIARAIKRGLADFEAGRVVSHEEAVERVRSWRK
jgi:hypothetical protein